MKNWLGKTDNFEELYFKRKPYYKNSWNYIKYVTEKIDDQWWYQFVYNTGSKDEVGSPRKIAEDNIMKELKFLYFSENTYEITEEEYLIGLIK